MTPRPFRAAALLCLAATAGAQELRIRPTPITHGVAPFRRVVRSLAVHQGDVWFGTYGSGLFRIHADGEVERFHAAASPLIEDRVNVLEPYQGALWIGTCAGIQVYGPEGFGAVHRAGPGSVAGDIYHALEALPSGGVAAGTTGSGISRYHEGAWETWAAPEGLHEGWVNALLETPDGSLWVATGRGLFRGRGGRFERVPGRGRSPPLDAELVSLAHQGGMLWIGAAKLGLYGYREGWYYQIPPEDLPSGEVLSLATDREDTLWVGTGRGLLRYRLDTGLVRVPPASPARDEEIKVLEALEDGRVLAGTYSGKVLLRPPGEGAHFRVLADLDAVLGSAPPATGSRPGHPLPSVDERSSP